MFISLLPPNWDHVMIHLGGCNCSVCTYFHGISCVSQITQLQPLKWIITWFELAGNKDINTLAEYVYCQSTVCKRACFDLKRLGVDLFWHKPAICVKCAFLTILVGPNHTSAMSRSEIVLKPDNWGQTRENHVTHFTMWLIEPSHTEQKCQ